MIKLICVTPNNNNKFYYMENLNNGTFKVEYGRVGASSTTLTYPIAQWDKKYNEKIKKGYVDISEKISTKKAENDLDIADKDVRELIKFLMYCSKQSISRDYNISAANITEAQIALVQQKLDELNDLNLPQVQPFRPDRPLQLQPLNDRLPIDAINNLLKEIYTIIPRKMSDTRSCFLQNDLDRVGFHKLLQDEQKRLDTLKTQVCIDHIDTAITLDTLGFSCELASDEDKAIIAKNTDFRVAGHKIFKINNPETDKIFNPNKLKTKLLYHGSKNENFLSIIQNGLKIRPQGVATTGSMFGNGIYAANKARKSIGYTSLKGSYWANGSSNVGYLAIFEFATGKEYPVLKNNRYQSWMGRLTEAEVKAKGYDSVFAQGGADLMNDEYIIYNSNQCTIRYLIELTK